MTPSSSLFKNTSLRIIALPLARRAAVRQGTETKLLTYYHFQLASHQGKETDGSALKRGTTWVLNKANSTWASFGKAEAGSWKLRLYQWGERQVDRIDFEELALKSVDPSLGPSVLHPDISGKEIETKTKSIDTISLRYPPSIVSGPSSITDLQHLLLHRTPRHRRGFWLWLCASPFTAPFMIIPIIPNIPFFFCAWRAWSHYRAYRSSQYLEACFKRDLIVAEPDQTLDTAYKQGSAEGASILDRESGLKVAKLMEIEEAELLRAVEQARSRTT